MNIADTLFDSASQMKLLFAENILNNSNEEATTEIKEFLSVLVQLEKIAKSISIELGDFENRMKRLYNLAEQIGRSDARQDMEQEYGQFLDELLDKVIMKRQKYCIIRRNDSVPGLGSHIITNLGQIELSIKEGDIPIIDMQYANNPFAELSRSKNQNAWELFFKQPYGVCLNDIRECQENAIIMKDGIPGLMPNYNMEFLTNTDQMDAWRRVAGKYMQPSDTIKNNVKKATDILRLSERRVLGILCRGTDYTGLKPYNHPVQPSVTEVIQRAETVMKKYDCEFCYLATEDDNIRSIFQGHFKGRLIISQDLYYEKVSKVSLTEYNKQSHMDLYQKNVEYLTALFLLSRCNCLIGGRTSGVMVSLLLSDSFDYMYFWNKGRYGIDDKASLYTLR